MLVSAQFASALAFDGRTRAAWKIRTPLCKDEKVIAEVSGALKAQCKKGGLLPFETPSAYALVCAPDGMPAWTPDNDLLTSTMKLKRPIIAKTHAAEIDDAYARS